ncbi:MAG: DUF6265 family protein [Thermoanaerobaculia bacterium]
MLRRATLALLFVITAPALSAHGEPKIEALAWMAGAWKLESGSRVVEEIWMAPSGGTMIGAGRTVGGGKTKFFEFLRIEQRDHELVYVAMPRGGKPVEFTMGKMKDQRVVFENFEHDFPQTIKYWRDGAKLCARVEGEGQDAEEWCFAPAR